MSSLIETNLNIAVNMGYMYAFVWVMMSVSTTAVSVVIILNADRLSTIEPVLRRSFFGVFLILCLLNIPFGVFFSKFFLALGESSVQAGLNGPKLHPFFLFGSLAAQTGIASHILFAVFYSIACLAVERRAR